MVHQAKDANRWLGRSTSRRRMLQGSMAVGGGALAASVGGLRFTTRHSARASQATPTFTGEASITSWGFGGEDVLGGSRIEAFRQAYPNIQIELIPELEEQQLLTAAASDTLPDILWVDRFKISSYAARGLLMPLDDLVERDGLDLTRYYDAALNEATYDDQLFGIPQFMDVRPLYVNLDALQEVGFDPAQLDTSNWDQLSELGEQLVKRNGDQVERWGFDPKLQSTYLWLWGQGNGGTFITDDGQEVTYDDPKIVEALEWGVNAYEVQGGFQLHQGFATTWQGNEEFARGQVAMTLYENWMLGIVARVAPDLNFTVVPILERGGEEMVSFTGGSAWAITEGAPEPDAAWEFIKFMDAEETWRIGAEAVKADRIATDRPYTPSLTANRIADQLQIEEIYEPIAAQFDEAIRLFPELLEASQNRPASKSPVSTQLEEILRDEGIMPALNGEASAEESLAQADQSAQDAIDSF